MQLADRDVRRLFRWREGYVKAYQNNNLQRRLVDPSDWVVGHSRRVYNA